jgi:DNA-binding winged helix-turn-helix (wHTH) protein
MDRQFAFCGFRFDPRTGELWGDGKQARLTPRAAAVFTMLAECAPNLVSKQELFERVWGGLVVGDDALTSCIQELRQALGDDARAPRYIETRHRRGYRLVEPVTVIGEDAVLNAPRAGHHPSGPLPLPDRPSIAVLPFVDMSGEGDQEHFADGITEDLITGR